ncbi:MAG: transcriptional regulator [Richelia sp. CSU_2_1]|nr:transcriptional regulator [Microcoleus sp. SM1_3_4]NJR23096.1 transcriptional regulator [Richelia sp. CSU_2_1]
MTSQLQQAIYLARSLSFAEQLELLKTLSAIIQYTHSLETQTATTEEDDAFADAEWVESVRTKIDAAIEASTHTPPIDGEIFVNQILERFQQANQTQI